MTRVDSLHDTTEVHEELDVLQQQVWRPVPKVEDDCESVCPLWGGPGGPFAVLAWKHAWRRVTELEA